MLATDLDIKDRKSFIGYHHADLLMCNMPYLFLNIVDM